VCWCQTGMHAPEQKLPTAAVADMQNPTVRVTSHTGRLANRCQPPMELAKAPEDVDLRNSCTVPWTRPSTGRHVCLLKTMGPRWALSLILCACWWVCVVQTGTGRAGYMWCLRIPSSPKALHPIPGGFQHWSCCVYERLQRPRLCDREGALPLRYLAPDPDPLQPPSGCAGARVPLKRGLEREAGGS
jgi:hypothetical protein